MDFYGVLEQVLGLLQRYRRVSYRALKRQFNLDDDDIADLKDELIDVQQCAVDEGGIILVWTGEAGGTRASRVEVQRQHDVRIPLHGLLTAVIALLQHEGRVTYRALTQLFGLQQALLDEVRNELVFKRLAIDEDGKGLVWTGGEHSAILPTVRSGLQQGVTYLSAAWTCGLVLRTAIIHGVV